MRRGEVSTVWERRTGSHSVSRDGRSYPIPRSGGYDGGDVLFPTPSSGWERRRGREGRGGNLRDPVERDARGGVCPDEFYLYPRLVKGVSSQTLGSLASFLWSPGYQSGTRLGSSGTDGDLDEIFPVKSLSRRGRMKLKNSEVCLLPFTWVPTTTLESVLRLRH